MRVGMLAAATIGVSFALFLPAQRAFGDGPVLLGTRAKGSRILPPRAPELIGAYPVLPRDGSRAWIEAALGLERRREGEGGGGDVLNLIAIQVRYLDSNCSLAAPCPAPCNVVRLAWQENMPNPNGVEIYVNDVLLGRIPGVPEANLPGVNVVDIRNVPAGAQTFRVEEDNTGTFSEVTITVLDAQPFADVQGLSCRQGRVTADGCELYAEFTNVGPFPDDYLIVIDGRFRGTIPSRFQGVLVPGMTPGNHCIMVIGELRTPEGIYWGCPVQSCCDLSCEDLPCNPPVDLDVCQVDYEAEGGVNTVRLNWINGEQPYAQGVNGFVDGVPAGGLPNNAQGQTPTQGFFEGLPAGEYTFGIQGRCGEADGVSTITEDRITVLASTPHSRPTEGPVICTFDLFGDQGPTTTATWTPGDPSAFIEVYLRRGEDFFFLGFLRGDATEVEVVNTEEDDRIVLQFFTILEGGCYGSSPIECTEETGPQSFFIPGICNGLGNTPQITSAIFGLNYLFIGGQTPGCFAACDIDGNGRLEITDFIRLLNYLFTGGPAPAGWVDQTGDGVPDPTCVPINEGIDCQQPSAACAK
jgi:hypothetical protein